MIITLVAGARPNFVKIAPIIKAIHHFIEKGFDIKYRLIHTGQHYDNEMSETFFKELNIPTPNENLACGGGSQAEQTASIMIKFEKELIEHKPTLVLVVGDVTSTMACSITARKLSIDVAHVEAGIRSNDLNMPEEINRIITDAISTHFFTTSKLAGKNLEAINTPKQNIHFVGNVMIDTLLEYKDSSIKSPFFDEHNLKSKKYLLLTLHRPSNVDNEIQLQNLLEQITDSADDLKIVFPVHPRTKLKLYQLEISYKNLLPIEPQSYLKFLYLIQNSLGIITDSGGITEEATILNIPCISLRDTTERPETIEVGTNELVGHDLKKLDSNIQLIKNNKWKKGMAPPLWDGQSSNRIIKILCDYYKQ